MKKIFYFALVIVASVVSCSKTEVGGDFSNEVPVVMEFGGLYADVVTKMTDAVNGNSHTFSWDAGDEISMFVYKKPTAAGESSAENVVNFSRNRFVALASGNTAKFKGMVPRTTINGKFGASGTVPVWGIYPATELKVAEKSNTSNASKPSATSYYAITGPSIPNVQDGTGLKYCYFVTSAKFAQSGASSAPLFGLGGLTIAASPVTSFSLSNALVKFDVNSDKDIKKVVISSKNSYLAGNATYHTLYVGIQSGCTEKTLTIENGDILPSELYFACRLLNNHDGKGGKEEIVFTFIAADGTKTEKKLIPTAQYKSASIYDLGTVDLTKATWE